MTKKPKLRVLPYVPPEVTVPGLGGVCDECLKKNGVGNNVQLVVYCEHFSCGAVIALVNGEVTGPWRMYAPVSMTEWADAVASGQNLAAFLLAQKLAASAGGEPPDLHKTEH